MTANTSSGSHYPPMTVYPLPTLPAPCVRASTSGHQLYYSSSGKDTNPGTAALPRRNLPNWLDGNTRYWLARGGSYDRNISVYSRSDVVVDAWGDITLPLPVISAGGYIVSYDSKSTRIEFKNVRFDSPLDGSRQPTGLIGQMRGTDIGFYGCEFNNLSEAVRLVQVVRAAVVDCVQTGVVLGRCLMVTNCTDLAWTGCTFKDSVNESTVRTTTDSVPGQPAGGGVVRGLFQNNRVGRVSNSKAAVTIRQADQLTIDNLVVTGANLSFNTEANLPTTIQNWLLKNFTLVESCLELRSGASRGTVTGGSIGIHCYDLECVSDSSGTSAGSPIVVTDLLMTGKVAGVKVYANGVDEYGSNQFTPLPGGRAVIEGAKYVDLGGNVTV